MPKKYDKLAINQKCVGYLRDYAADMSELQTAREQAIKAYMMQPYGNELPNRSHVVMSDVFNTIESIMPSMMRIFMGSADIVQVTGQGAEDDNKAVLMAELLNYQSRKSFNGFTVFHDWFKDAFLYKMGVVKYFWHTETKRKNKVAKGLTEDEYNSILSRDNVEITKTSETVISGTVVDIDGTVLVPAVKTIDAEFVEITKISKPIVEVLPPEEFIFDVRAKVVTDSFCAHKKRVAKASLKKYGITVADVSDAVVEMSGENLENERFRDLGGQNFLIDETDDNFCYIYECYYNEYDDNGDPQPIKAVIMGNRVIDVEVNQYGKPPFRELSAIRLTHRSVGRSFADLVDEVQKLKTALVRYILDNIYYQNNGQRVVNPYKINIDDLFDQNFPGGIVRTLDISTPIGDAYQNLPVAPLPPQVFSFLEYADGSILENRTGVTRYNQGLDSQSLNKTATGISQIMSASQQRIELIARIFAETGVKGLYEDLAQMNLDFLDQSVKIKINDKWAEIRPEDIDAMYDINIDVGIGTGSKEIMTQQLMSMLQIYLNGLLQIGVVTPENVSEMVKAIWQNMGFKNADKFVQEMNSLQAPKQLPPELASIMQSQQQMPTMPQLQEGVIY